MSSNNFYIQALIVTLGVLTQSCGQDSSKMKEAWADSHNPEIISGSDLEYRFGRLPMEGQTKLAIWSDDYWPSYRGGISYRWLDQVYGYELLNREKLQSVDISRLSPAEKYDLFMGRLDFPTVRSELTRTKVLRTINGSSSYQADYSIPSWYGLCHGWAPAAINFKEPAPTIVMGATGLMIPFGSSDIKALLSYYQQYPGNRSARIYFMSERCNLSFQNLDDQLAAGEIAEYEYHKLRNDGACKGVNAGAFHLALTNEIGRKNLSIIADVTRDIEVWNQPISAFKSRILRRTVGASEGAAPGTIQEIKLETTITYKVSMNARWVQFAAGSQKRRYQYTIEINDQGEIIGGRWIGDDRPDFLWRQAAPDFRGYFRALEFIYRQSLAG